MPENAVIREDLLPTTEKSRKLIRMLRDRVDLSYRTISQKYSDWDTVEEHFRSFRPYTSKDVDSMRKNQVQEIIVPIQFATIMTMVTFLMEIFTALKPTLRIRGADPASVRTARVMEACLDYDYRGNRGYFMLQQWMMNMCRYGYCPMENSWGQRSYLKRSFERGPSPGTMQIGGMTLPIPGQLGAQKKWVPTFEGNMWQLQDPRAWYPDPRLPISRFQEGEFCGKRVQNHDYELARFEDAGLMFNTTKIESQPTIGRDRDAEMGIYQSSRDKIAPEQALVTDLAAAKKYGQHINEQMITELIPENYDLGDERRPEQWLFNLIDGTTITRAEENPFYGFNYSVIENFPDMLAFMAQGMMEFTEPLSAHISFLFNSHMANVRKAINDMLVVDPSRVDIRDLIDPNPGKLIRLLPEAYGTDPAAVAKQLGIVDITRGHFEDVKMILDLWQMLTGVSTNMFGAVNRGRRTSSELSGVMRAAGSRMKMMGDLISSEGIGPLTELMAVTRQQNMSKEQFIRIVGRTAEELGVRPDDIVRGGDSSFLRVQPEYIQGVFEYPAEEGCLPQDRQASSELLMKVFDTVARAPFLASVFDPVEIFTWAARIGGLPYIEDFLQRGVRAKVTVLEDERVRELLAAGKIQPMGAPGRPDQGVRSGREGLGLEGMMEGAGIPGGGNGGGS